MLRLGLGQIPFSPSWQTMAILAELGPQRFCAALKVDDEQVSLATYSLLHVMFDSLKEGLQRDIRGKEDAVVLGESPMLLLSLALDRIPAVVWESVSLSGLDVLVTDG